MPIKRVAKVPPRDWRVSIIRKKLVYLGRVHAVDKPSAADAAAAEFNLTDHERRRLLVEEVPA